MQSYVQTQTAMLSDSFRQEAFRSLRNTPHIVQNITHNLVALLLLPTLKHNSFYVPLFHGHFRAFRIGVTLRIIWRKTLRAIWHD